MKQTQDPQAVAFMSWLVRKEANAGFRGWAYGLTIQQLWAAGCGGRISARWLLDQLCWEGIITRQRAIKLDAKYKRQGYTSDDMRGIKFGEVEVQA